MSIRPSVIEPADLPPSLAERVASSANERTPPLSCTRLSEWFGRSPPARRWIVPNWIPGEGEVTGLYGPGGVGKSFVAQMTQTATALNLDWFGLSIEPVRSLGIYCEDSANELWRRQHRIVGHLLRAGADAAHVESALSSATVCSRLGQDNLLMTFGSGGKGEVTTFRNQILERALDEKCRLVVLDNAATMFPGNPVDQSQVRQFVDIACGQIATKINGAVLLCAHPSKGGIASGEGDSGSVQWNAALRSRLYLSHLASDDCAKGKVALSRKKGNYADVESADQILLRWERGVLVHNAPKAPTGPRPPATKVFLDLLSSFDAAGRNVSDKPRSGNYAPWEFSRERESHGYRRADFEASMRQLFDDGAIRVEQYGPPSRHYSRIINSSDDGAQRAAE